MAAAVASAKVVVVEALVGGHITAVVMGKTAAECDATAGKYDTGLDVAMNALLHVSIVPPPIKVGEIAVAVGIAIMPAPAALANLLLLTASTAAAAAWCGCGIIIAKGTL